MFYLVNKTEDLSLRNSISNNSERLFRRGMGEARTLWEFLHQNQVVRISEITFNKGKPAISRNLVLFNVGEDAKVRAPWSRSSDVQLISRAFSPWVPFCCSSCLLDASILCFHPESPQGSLPGQLPFFNEQQAAFLVHIPFEASLFLLVP